MTDFIRGAATLVGAFLVFAVSWTFIGFAARVVQTLFCWGYGC
jgi:hypothetical protein